MFTNVVMLRYSCVVKFLYDDNCCTTMKYPGPSINLMNEMKNSH